jgi:hypothetical protein
MMLTNKELQSLRNLGNEAEAAVDEIERLRAVVAKGRAAYSAYGVLATPPNHELFTVDGHKLRTEWLRETDDYLQSLRPNVADKRLP